MSRLVYACRFDVVVKGGIENVLFTYRNWIVENYQIRRSLSAFNFDPKAEGSPEGLPAHHLLSSSTYKDGNEHVVRIYWSFPDEFDEGLRWANEVRVGQFGGRCGVEHLISIESVEYSVAPARLHFGSPGAIREICMKTRAYIAEMQIRAEPYDLEQDGVSDLLTLLTSDLRKLPVVLLSPYAQGESNQIDPEKLARNLAGVAVVVHAQDPEVIGDIADELGRELSCFNGGARIYWPGFSKESDPRRHRLLLGAWIQQVGPAVAARTIERAIFAVAAFRYVPDSRIADVIRRTESAQRQKLFVEKRETGDDFWADYERDLARLDEVEVKLEELEAENANLRANQQVIFTTGVGSPDELEQPDEADGCSFSSVAEAVQAAAKRCQNLDILDSATSAAEDSPFQRPFEIYNALTDLNDIVDDWNRNRNEKGSGGDLLSHLRNRGWGKRSSMHISNTTRGKYQPHYEFEYQGKKRLFEPHITIGAGDANSCASIHFIFDEDRLKMIVGHIGKHLPNTKT